MTSMTAPNTADRAQFLRFCVVGASGYLVNICAFAISLALCAQHLVAAACGFTVAMVTNFAWNRRWTFASDDRARAKQAGRFFVVSVAACMVAATILELLVGTAGLSPLAAQPAAVIAATPLSFLGAKKWSFAEPTPAAPMRAAARRNTWLVVPTYNEAENLEPFVR